MILIINIEINLKLWEKIMKKITYTVLLLIGSISIFAQNNQDVEEVEVKGKVLYVDQVNSLTPPVPILDVPQSVSVVTVSYTHLTLPTSVPV